MAVESRHVAAKGLITFSNFIGWVCVISIILLPVGLMILLQGHFTLAVFETEENTRATLKLLESEYIKVKNIG